MKNMDDYVKNLEKFVEELQQRTAEVEHKAAKLCPKWKISPDNYIEFGTDLYTILWLSPIVSHSKIEGVPNKLTYEIIVPKQCTYCHFRDVNKVVFNSVEEAKQAVEEIYDFYRNE